MKSMPRRARRLVAVIQPLERRLMLTGNTGMTNIGQVDLPTGVPAQYSAAIDPTTGFGYFGSASGANPGIVSKVNLNGPLPTVVQDGLPNSIPTGVAKFNAIEIDTTSADPTQHFLYVAGAGGKILKMSPGDATHDPQVVSILTPTSATGGVICGAIDTSSPDPTQRYAYFGIIETSDVKVLRIRLSDFSDQGSETINMPNVRTCAIDTIHHYLYFTTYGSASVPAPEICKVNLATFTPGGTSTATYSMGSTVPGDGIAVVGSDTPTFDVGLSIDPVHQFAYMGSFSGSPGPANNSVFPYNQSVIVRVNLGNGDAFPAHPLSEIKLGVGERNLTTSVIDLANGNVYFGTDLTYPGHVYMIHVGDGTQPMTEVGRLDLNLGTMTSYPPDGTTTGNNSPEAYGEIFLRSSILDVAQNAIYIGTDSRPGQIVKVGINGGSVAGRFVFYADSSFDGNNSNAASAPTVADFNAIAPDKIPLLPGQTATFSNYTSYSRGINGVFVDLIGDVPGSITAADFEFSVGNTSTPGTGSSPGVGWTKLATAPTVTVFPGMGVGGADRIGLTWRNGTITGKWLQVTILLDNNTGLPAPDVFYFGNAIGDSGNSTTDAEVNATDEVNARNDPHSNFSSPAPITDPNDFDRDARTNATDEVIARDNGTDFETRLKLITVPGLPNNAGVSAPAAISGAAVQAAARTLPKAAIITRGRKRLHHADQRLAARAPELVGRVERVVNRFPD